MIANFLLYALYFTPRLPQTIWELFGSNRCRQCPSNAGIVQTAGSGACGLSSWCK